MTFLHASSPNHARRGCLTTSRYEAALRGGKRPLWIFKCTAKAKIYATVGVGVLCRAGLSITAHRGDNHRASWKLASRRDATLRRRCAAHRVRLYDCQGPSSCDRSLVWTRVSNLHTIISFLKRHNRYLKKNYAASLSVINAAGKLSHRINISSINTLLIILSAALSSFYMLSMRIDTYASICYLEWFSNGEERSRCTVTVHLPCKLQAICLKFFFFQILESVELHSFLYLRIDFRFATRQQEIAYLIFYVHARG